MFLLSCQRRLSIEVALGFEVWCGRCGCFSGWVLAYVVSVCVVSVRRWRCVCLWVLLDFVGYTGGRLALQVESYTAANSFPVKILRNDDLMQRIKAGRVVPYHVQLNPTNKCNYHCGFCSCENRDRSLSIPFPELAAMVQTFHSLGMSSVSVTGGGDPLLYRDLSSLFKILCRLGVEVGLVCNGSLLNRLTASDLGRIRWCRVSCSDVLKDQISPDLWFSRLDSAVAKDSCVDWAVSYVVGANPDLRLLKRVVDYANEKAFTHVRVVSDLLSIESVPNMNAVRAGLLDLGVDISKVIFQGRKSFVRGSNPCYISLLKPVVGADGNLYPCCGVQYALDKPSRDYEKKMCMGNWRELPRLIDEQKFYDGSNCVRCYYNEYQFIGNLVKPLEHVRFV